MIRNEVFSNGVCISAEIIDLGAGTYSIEQMGVIASTRPLTAMEIDQYTPDPGPITAELKLTQAGQVLDQLDQLPAPVLTADVVDLLADLREVLNGNA